MTRIQYDAKLTSQMIIYPNPIEEVLNIKVPGAKITTFEIISINGITVEKGEILNGIESIDVTGLSKGIYFININSDGKVARKSFIKL